MLARIGTIEWVLVASCAGMILLANWYLLRLQRPRPSGFCIGVQLIGYLIVFAFLVALSLLSAR